MSTDPVQWLYDLQHFGIKLGLDNIRALLGLLDHPERAFRNVAVAGTNGKGSVASMLASMLDAHGIRSGLFTSPHLVRPNERIRVGGQDITTDDLHRWLRDMRRRVEQAEADGRPEGHPSFFEVMTATALGVFREREVRAAVLEVGLGGRLDATNAVEADVSVVVSVDFDHMKTLGRSILLIAAEKAGIVKPGRPVVSGVDRPDALGVLRNICLRRDAPLLEARELTELVDEQERFFSLRTPRTTYRELELSLDGSHQRQNARVAVLTLETLLDEMGRAADEGAVRQGLAAVRWPGRLQWVEGDPDLLLDGAHNVSGALALAEFLERSDRPKPVMLFGAMRGKNIPGILEPLQRRIERLVITKPGVHRSLEPEAIADVAATLGIPHDVVTDPADAFRQAAAQVPTGSYLLVAGSLYLVGQVLGLHEREPSLGPVSM